MLCRILALEFKKVNALVF